MTLSAVENKKVKLMVMRPDGGGVGEGGGEFKYLWIQSFWQWACLFSPESCIRAFHFEDKSEGKRAEPTSFQIIKSDLHACVVLMKRAASLAAFHLGTLREECYNVATHPLMACVWIFLGGFHFF